MLVRTVTKVIVTGRSWWLLTEVTVIVTGCMLDAAAVCEERLIGSILVLTLVVDVACDAEETDIAATVLSLTVVVESDLLADIETSGGRILGHGKNRRSRDATSSCERSYY